MMPSMRRGIAIALLTALPFAALALDVSDRTQQLNDTGTLSTAERVAVSVLMRAGAVQGYPDGFFHPRRLVNRAEFMKIVTISADLDVGADMNSCFPDVIKGMWFHPYICSAKQRNIVAGNPDGFFHPERPVNHVEALKILSELYNYDLPEPPANVQWTWYQPYLRAAERRGILLPTNISPDTLLTRAQVARLTAAALAEAEGKLEDYRAAERGQVARSASSSSIPNSSSSRSSVSSSSNASSTPFSTFPDLPARSRFLILGDRTEPIASANFFNHQEAMIVRGATVKFENEAKSIDALFLINSSGTEIGRLSLDPYDTDDETWKATFSSGDGYVIPQDQEHTLAIEALMKGSSSGGMSEELMQVDKFTITVEGGYTHNTYASTPPNFPFPQHQTTLARIIGVTNALEPSGGLPVGTNQLVASFLFRTEEITQANPAITQLELEISKSSNVLVSGFRLGATDTNTTVECTVSGIVVTCANIPEELGALQAGSRTLRLSADVSLSSGTQSSFLQLSLNQPGAIGVNGAVRWTDGTGAFNWVELPSPVARGTRWE